MILIVDNFDSFTYNIVQYAGCINSDIKIIKNNEHRLNDIKKMKFTHIIISPGPGRPENTGICAEIINEYMSKVPILGICLGHQLIAQHFGASIIAAKQVVHGKTSMINIIKNSKIFKGVPLRFEATRYHSLLVSRNGFKDIQITSCTSNGEIMSIEYSENKIYGLQFHPESIKTKYGFKIINNFLNIV